jgi:signal transduction histidine kinase
MRLFQATERRAGLEERQRLARELHDSVSQSLFAIALTAAAACRVSSTDPSQLAPMLDDVDALAQSALAEMRALVFELRPEALEREGVVTALEKHVAAIRSRHKLEVRVQLGSEPCVPLQVKEALYRIGQEAMHNAVKHAAPTAIEVRLARVGEYLRLEVNDDGRGFDSGGSFPGHLGLQSMRERVRGVGGALTVDTAPGEGTRIRAVMPIVTPLSVGTAATGRAVLEERQRLARELDESVSQVLYAIALATAAARSPNGRGHIDVAATLEEVHRLAQSALAEVRALIFGLRPESLPTGAASRTRAGCTTSFSTRYRDVGRSRRGSPVGRNVSRIDAWSARSHAADAAPAG